MQKRALNQLRKSAKLAFPILTLSLSLGFACQANASLKDGTYETSTMGNNGPVVLKTTIKNGEIVSVSTVKSDETPLLGSGAIEKLTKAIVEGQTVQLDAVSGASNSSRAILEGVKSALKMAGGSEKDLKSVTLKKPDAAVLKDATTDVLVIGAGGAGMCAAISATDSGARVILIEKQPNVGGTTLFSTTSVTAGGSRLQMKMDKPFTADDFIKKLLVEFPDGDSPTLRQHAQRTGATVDWLMDMGADLGKVINNSQHVTTSGKALGTMLVPVLKSQIDKRKIDTRLQTKAVELIVDQNGTVAGAVVETPEGKYSIHAKSVILATGGFASNPEFVAKYTPQWAGYPSTASKGSTGDGLVLAQKVKAAMSHMDVAGPQTVAYDTGNGAVSLTNVRYNGAIILNKEGRRFVNELGNKNTIGMATKKQTDGVGYLFFDQTCLDRGELLKKYKMQGYFVQAETPEKLAEKLGIDPNGLKETLKEWKVVFDTKKDAKFGRKDSIFSAFDKAPFYGQKTSPANQVTFGGLTRDLNCNVVNTDGKPVQGLFVCGETADQFGHGVSIAVTTGKLAGECAAKNALKQP